MDIIDVDLLLDVPETPDRLIAAARDSDRYRIVNKDYNGRIRSQYSEKFKPVTANGNHRLFVHPSSRNNSPNARPTIDTARHDKGKALCDSYVQKSTHHVNSSFSGLTEKNGHGQFVINRVNAARKGVLPIIGTTEFKSCKLSSTAKTGPSSDRGKGVDVFSESNASFSMQHCSSSKVPQKKMLVRNGCISPHNIVKSKNVVEKHEIGSLVKEQRSDSGALASASRSSVVDIMDRIAKAIDSRICKIGVASHPSSEEPNAESSHLSQRRHVLKEPVDNSSVFSVDTSRRSGALAAESQSGVVDIKELIAKAKASRQCKRGVSSHPSFENAGSSNLSHRIGILKEPAKNSRDVSVDTSRCSSETEGWRTTHNDRKQRDTGQQKNEIMQINRSNERNIEHRDDDAHKLGINRPREDSALNSSRKRSMSCIDDSEGEPSTSRSKRNKNLNGTSTSNPVLEPNSNNEDARVRALQIEADEILARELQDQFYDEELTPAEEVDEMDIPPAFAMPAHQDDRSQSAGSRRASRRVSHHTNY